MKPRDVTTGATRATAVATKILDTLTLSQPRGQILPSIAEVPGNIFFVVTSLKPNSNSIENEFKQLKVLMISQTFLTSRDQFGPI